MPYCIVHDRSLEEPEQGAFRQMAAVLRKVRRVKPKRGDDR